jgi:phosphopantetheine adenylyltransferase
MADVIEIKHPEAVMTYGRFNPPTIGHKMLIDKVIEKAGNNRDAYVVLSHSQNAIKNPLFVTEKINIIRQMFPDKNILRILHTSKDEPFIGKIIEKMLHAGYSKVILVVGSDRVDDFKRALKGLSSVEIVSGGERDPDSDITNISGVSATKIRQAALSGNRGTVRAGIDPSILNSQLNFLIKTIRNRTGKSKRATKSRKGLKKTRRKNK